MVPCSVFKLSSVVLTNRRCKLEKKVVLLPSLLFCSRLDRLRSIFLSNKNVLRDRMAKLLLS